MMKNWAEKAKLKWGQGIGIGGEMGWRQSAKKKGLKTKDLFRIQ